ncbi:hypothetical protein PVAP13_7NG090545 [Panicum virgatum]|uniref:Uncharacterized protein n=1 Tax=Panicum virgatum TaxID=38727 RepID=A0A8T0PTY9_PANVG|nr:hypothetical protein PVAP13_7NG090545 [Panicum virgatum]
MWNQVLTFINYKLLDIDAPKQETIDDRGFFVFALTVGLQVHRILG